jgi:tetratricopeptide (TPR) repeat protein
MMPHADLLFDLVRVNLKIAELQISIEADPLYPENYLRLLEVAGLYYSQKEYTQALRYIDRSLALNPRFADAYFLQGLCQEARGKREEARFAYWTALRCNPAFYPARTQLEALKASNPDPGKNIE